MSWGLSLLPWGQGLRDEEQELIPSCALWCPPELLIPGEEPELGAAEPQQLLFLIS